MAKSFEAITYAAGCVAGLFGRSPDYSTPVTRDMIQKLIEEAFSAGSKRTLEQGRQL